MSSSVASALLIAAWAVSCLVDTVQAGCYGNNPRPPVFTYEENVCVYAKLLRYSAYNIHVIVGKRS